jgi:hypothetical protein
MEECVMAEETKESWLYRLYCTKSQNADGELLYVGISDSPSSRMGNHESQKWWWWLVGRVEWTRCHDRRHAENDESRAITHERPLFNRSESNLCGWERLRDVIYLLWAHEQNSCNLVCCPFCDSHGKDEFLSPDGVLEVFRRNEDDKVVLHFVVECSEHERVPRWAVHVCVKEFLARNNVPRVELDRLCRDAVQSGNIPWENRYERESTLLEKLHAASCAFASDHHSVHAIEAK